MSKLLKEGNHVHLRERKGDCESWKERRQKEKERENSKGLNAQRLLSFIHHLLQAENPSFLP